MSKYETRQWCIAGFAPGTPCTMDSSGLGTRRRLGHDAINTFMCNMTSSVKPDVPNMTP